MLLHVLVVDPAVSLLHALAEPNGRFPAERVPHPVVVGVASVDSLWGAEVVAALEMNTGDLFDDVHELVDGHQFAGPEIDWFQDVALRDGERALHAVVDVHEGARLAAVAPDLDAVPAGS